MNRHLFLLLSLLFLLPVGSAYAGDGYTRMYTEIVDGESITVVDITPVFIFPPGYDTRKFQRLIYNVKVVYPIAKEANRMLREMETHMLTLNTKKEQEAYVKAMEKELKKRYTPVLREMTFSQGKILIKLIDRETSQTSYALVKELRGGFSAFLWQGVARLFGANLKDRYDPTGEDRTIEWIIQLYEAGEI